MEINIVNKNQRKEKLSSCSNLSEQERLLKLFEIFIEIDKNLKKNENRL